MPWEYGAAMDIGGRQEQQDRLCIMKSHDQRRFLLAVADGMGGLRNGAQAAQTVIDTAAQQFNCPNNPDAHMFLQHICFTAHQAINDLPNGGAAAPGTTAALLYIEGRAAFWTHVGDSRLYHFRNGRLLTQTQDHSLLHIMLAKGIVTPGSDAAKSLQNQLYMRLGGERLPRPEYAAATIADGDLFLLCSDGFWQTVEPAQVLAAVEAYPLGGTCEQYLVALARQLGGEQCDNISLVMIRWHDGGVRSILRRMAAWLYKRGNVARAE